MSEQIWKCVGCGRTFVEYVNGCPHHGDVEIAPRVETVTSDLERAQEWLGCRLDVRVIPESIRIAPCPPRCALHGGSTWPCKQATRLAALLAETRRQALDDAARWIAEAVEEKNHV